MRILLFFSFLSLPFAMGCDAVRNRLDRRVLDCGTDARGGDAGLWIKVLDPNGNELPESEQLDARSLRLGAAGQLPPQLAVSQKHCVNADPNETLVIRSRATDRSWSALITRDALTRVDTVRLQDSSQQTVHLRCPNPWVNNGLMKLPLESNAGLPVDAVALAPSLLGPDGQRWSGGFGLQKDAGILIWPQDWPDGVGRLTLTQKNFLQNDASALAQKEESCEVIIDRETPQLAVTPSPDAAGQLEVAPGTPLHLKAIDAHPLSIRWCLRAVESGSCEPQMDGADVSLIAPAQGRWVLEAQARDAAGNLSPAFTQSLAVIQRDVLHAIEARMDQALAEQGFAAGLSVLRALADYKRLVLPEEQDQVKRKIIDGILEVAPGMQERQRVLLKGSARRVWAVNQKADTPWLALTASELSLWSHEGLLLERIEVDDSGSAEWSESQQTLALGDGSRLTVIALKGNKFSEPRSVSWGDIQIDGYPYDIKWVPQSSQLVVALSGDLPLVIDAADWQVQARLDLKDSRRLAVSADGLWIAATTYDQVALWQKNQDKWELMGSNELGVKDLQFSSASDKVEARLTVLLSDGRLSAWSPSQVWKEVDANKFGEQPSEAQIGRDIPFLQSWSDGRSGLFERGGRFYQWQSDSSKTLQLVKISGFDWSKLRQWKLDGCRRGVWLQDDKAVSFWQMSSGAEPNLILRGSWNVAPDRPFDFASSCDPDNRAFMTLDENQSRLRFWSQRGPLPVFEADPVDTVFLRFFPDRLVAGGFDGILRFFDKVGSKLTQWTGHKGQVSDLVFASETQQYLSTAEDGTSRLWKPDGTSGPVLDIGSSALARIREGAVFVDKDHIVSTGMGQVAFWEFKNGAWSQLPSIALATAERSFEDGLRVVDGHVLVRLVSKNLWRVLILNARGEAMSEPGLPVLQGLKAVVWTPDGKTLATLDASKTLRVYSWSNGIWQEIPVAQTSGALTALSFAPDGQSLVALRDGRQLQLWQLQEGQWVLGATTSLSSSASLQNGLQWTADSSRIILVQSGRIFILDSGLRILHRFQAFPGLSDISSLAVSPDPLSFAVSSGSRVRVVDLDLDRLQNQFCGWLKAYLASDDDLVGDLENLRALCR